MLKAEPLDGFDDDDRVPAIRLESVDTLRAEAAHRGSAPVMSPPGGAAAAAEHNMLRVVFKEIGDALTSIHTVMPLLGLGDDSFRARVARDLVSLELERATSLAAAVALLTRVDEPAHQRVRSGDLLHRLEAPCTLGARLMGVQMEWAAPSSDTMLDGDAETLMTAWSALVHAALGLASPGQRLSLSVEATRVRPAFILRVALDQPEGVDGVVRSPEASHREGIAVLLAAAERGAQIHRGRLTVEQSAGGFHAVFAIPQPLD